MPRKCISGFAEAGAAMAQQLDDNDLLNLFSSIGRVVSKRFLMKRPSLDRWQLVIDYLHLLVEDQCSLLSVLLRPSICLARARKCAASFMHASLTSLAELWRAAKRQSSASPR